MGKEEKQFPLTTLENCQIYLNRIISSSELCMDKLKKYNNELKDVVEKYRGQDVVPEDIYSEFMDKTYNCISYLANLLGDGQTSSISYFKYRNVMEKRIKKGNTDIPIYEIDDETKGVLSIFNRERNWQNHIPESLLIADLERKKAGEVEIAMDPVTIIHYNAVTFEYFEHLYLSNVDFYSRARKVIQVAKKEYSLLMGKSITYPRVYIDVPLSVKKAEGAKKSAKVSGLPVESN